MSYARIGACPKCGTAIYVARRPKARAARDRGAAEKFGRCLYCGKRCRLGASACYEHADLPAIEKERE